MVLGAVTAGSNIRQPTISATGSDSWRTKLNTANDRRTKNTTGCTRLNTVKGQKIRNPHANTNETIDRSGKQRTATRCVLTARNGRPIRRTRLSKLRMKRVKMFGNGELSTRLDRKIKTVSDDGFRNMHSATQNVSVKTDESTALSVVPAWPGTGSSHSLSIRSKLNLRIGIIAAGFAVALALLSITLNALRRGAPMCCAISDQFAHHAIRRSITNGLCPLGRRSWVSLSDSIFHRERLNRWGTSATMTPLGFECPTVNWQVVFGGIW